jgi:hypothetical protein
VHFGIEDAFGGAVVGFERGSGGWLSIAKFFKGRTYGAGMFPAHVDGSPISASGDDDTTFLIVWQRTSTAPCVL